MKVTYSDHSNDLKLIWTSLEVQKKVAKVLQKSGFEDDIYVAFFDVIQDFKLNNHKLVMIIFSDVHSVDKLKSIMSENDLALDDDRIVSVEHVPSHVGLKCHIGFSL